MRYLYYISIFCTVLACNAQNTTKSSTTKNQNHQNTSKMTFNNLSEEEQRVIIHKGTESPGIGIYTDNEATGTYLCKQCNNPLYTSDQKFKSHCGWPSFDDEIAESVTRIPDADGRRTEIVCANCQGHLGHVFEGEHFTEKNTRHCVNSISMTFVEGGASLPLMIEKKEKNIAKLDTATFGAGCFWCVEVLFQKLKGVTHVESGYAAGSIKNPTYEMVSKGTTGSVEVIQITYDSEIITYETLVDILFHVHNPTTLNQQGADKGTQYRSAIFYHNDDQKHTAAKVLKETDKSDLWIDPIVTTIEPINNYSSAEKHHQDYYNNNATTNGYCSAVIGPKIVKFKLKYKDLIKD